MREFTQEMLDTLLEANESVKGTRDNMKYLTCGEFKHNGRWTFCGWGLPRTAGTIKTYKGTTYIMTKSYYGYEERFEIDDTIKELLNI